MFLIRKGSPGWEYQVWGEYRREGSALGRAKEWLLPGPPAPSVTWQRPHTQAQVLGRAPSAGVNRIET